MPGNSYAIFDASQVPPWNTTDDSNGIEIWGDAFLGVPAYEGANFAELNANSAGTLYQDVVTFPGATMTWTLHHRGRDTTDVMRVLIGDALLADVWSDDGWDWISGDIADDQTAWGASRTPMSYRRARPARGLHSERSAQAAMATCSTRSGSW